MGSFLAEPAWLALILLAVLPWYRSRKRPRASWPTLAGFEGRRAWPARWLGAISPLLRSGAIACLAVAMARPEEPGGKVRVAGRGVAIMAVLDRSSSMKAADFPAGEGSPPITRLEAARATLSRFLLGRPDDLIGVVAFANYPDMIAPPTLDARFLREAIGSIKAAGRVDDGTNIGDALAWALGAVRQAPALRKVLVLLTDGRNAPAVARPVDPMAAAEIGRELGITLHTIAIGGPGGAKPGPGDDPDGPDIPWLARLAEAGGGRAFVAADSGSLERVFREIDALEPSPVSGTVRTLYRELFAPWVLAALACLAIDAALVSGRLRRLP